MVYITRNYIRLFQEAQTFMRRHRLGVHRGCLGPGLAINLLTPICRQKINIFDDCADILKIKFDHAEHFTFMANIL
jgi:hypothetical protein